MNILASAFWGEGISDKRFLPVLIQRTIEAIMLQCAKGEWDVLEPLLIHPRRDSNGFVEQVLDLSRQAQGFHLLFIHTDADATDETQKAFPFKISPAIQAIQLAALSENLCQEIIPVIPVVKVENWKLCDSDALREALGTDLNDNTLGLNIGIRQLEEKYESKDMLADILKKINDGRRIPVLLEDLDAALAKAIRLQNINRYDSFQRFVERLKTSLITQNIIQEDCRPQL